MKNIFIKLAVYGFAGFGLWVSIALVHDEFFSSGGLKSNGQRIEEAIKTGSTDFDNTPEMEQAFLEVLEQFNLRKDIPSKGTVHIRA